MYSSWMWVWVRSQIPMGMPMSFPSHTVHMPTTGHMSTQACTPHYQMSACIMHIPLVKFQVSGSKSTCSIGYQCRFKLIHNRYHIHSGGCRYCKWLNCTTCGYRLHGWLVLDSHFNMNNIILVVIRYVNKKYINEMLLCEWLQVRVRARWLGLNNTYILVQESSCILILWKW